MPPSTDEGDDNSDSEKTSRSFLFAAALWLVALKYIMNIKQACHVGSSTLGDLRFRIPAHSRSWDITGQII